ncbi:LCP family protein, partial [Luedemannella helvata]|uniref:LCP family protein n=1 Tax=Luedemannella helvata TaxID=349315 RepID=UPI0031DAE752
MQSYAPSRPTSTVYGSPRSADDDDLPPDSGDEPTKGKGKKKKRRRFLPTDPGWAKSLLIVGAVLMIISGISGGIVVTGRAMIAYATKDIKQEDLIPDEIRAAGKNIDGELNILLLGLDERKNSDAAIRTDSIIIIHIPKSHDAVYLISLPRDTKVDIPAMPDFNYPGRANAKLTEVYQVGNQKNGKPDDSAAGRKRGVTATARV